MVSKKLILIRKKGRAKQRRAPRLPMIRLVNRKQRVARAANQNQQNLQYRDIATLTKRMARMGGNGAARGSMNDYLMCKLDPFSAMGVSAGIPDGRNANFIIMDNLAYDDILCVTNAGFVIQTTAWLPVPALIQGLGASGINDINVNSLLYNNAGSFNYGWCPLGCFSPYNQINSLPGLAVNDPYSSTMARIVSIGFKLIYTGQANTCSGTITVTPNTIALQEIGPTSSGALAPLVGQVAVSVSTLAQVVTGPINVNTPTMNADFTTNIKAFNKDSRIYRPEQGCYIIPPHRNLEYMLKPIGDVAYAVIGNNTTSNRTLGAGVVIPNFITYPPNTTGNFNGFTFFDNDWEGFQIVVSGVTAGATFRLQTIMCLEYNPQQATAFANLAEAHSILDERVMKQSVELDKNKASISDLTAKLKNTHENAQTLLSELATIKPP